MPDLSDIAGRIAGQAKPGEEIEAYVSWQRGTDVRIYEGEIEQLASAESSGIGIRVIKDGRQGFAYVGDLDEDHAREALAEARDNLGFASPDEHVGLAQPDTSSVVELDLWRDELESYPTNNKIELALELERQVRGSDARIRQVVSTDYGDAQGQMAIASSTGVRAGSRRTTCYLSTDAVAGEGDDTQTGTGYSVGRSPTDLVVQTASQDAVERATRLLGAKKPKSAQVNVVFDRRVTGTLLSILAGTLSGDEVAKGRSLFADRLGQQVGDASITLFDDPTNALFYGATSIDAEGLPCRRNALIDSGRLVGFLYDTYSARLASTASTASAVRGGFSSTPRVGARAIGLLPGELSQEEILASVGDGLFVQGISGVHSGVNRISGDFSVGAEGVMFRNGAFCEPVREITVASTIQRMLQHVLAIGSDIEYLPGVACGMSLAIGEIAMSGD